ncbi:MAG: hypothetical protein ACLRFN_04175 [Alphaproteobacteria bacterium]
MFINRFGVAMSYKCPYDGDFCQRKKDKLDSFESAVEYMAQNKINYTFIVSDKTFSGCPLEALREQSNCERYMRYLYISVQNLTKNK